MKYLPRVLDAWVKQHLSTIKGKFAAKDTVKDRRVHLSLPVMVDKTTLEPELSPERLKQLEAAGRLVLISGEGGVGKTSLALRITSWALDGELTEQPVVPVLVARDLEERETLLLALLKRRRLLENFAEGMMLHLRPQRLTADRLWPFFDAYLQTKKDDEPEVKEWDDDLLARSSDRLRQITAGLVDEQRGITVLLAKLYIDVVLAERKGEGVGVLPDSVPRLMLTDVNQINATIPEAERQDEVLVVRPNDRGWTARRQARRHARCWTIWRPWVSCAPSAPPTG